MKRNKAPRNKRRLTRMKGPGEVRSTVACAWSLGVLMMTMMLDSYPVAE